MNHTVTHSRPCQGTAAVPGDKSISHRALMFSSLACGTSTIRNLQWGRDVSATRTILEQLGVRITEDRVGEVRVDGVGLHGYRNPTQPLDCQSSGTTMRLMAGVLGGQGLPATLTGTKQLAARPMARVVKPLRAMNIDITCLGKTGKPPVQVLRPNRVHAHNHDVAIKSAQVKSAIILAGLYGDGPTTVRGTGAARDHTERMLRHMGAEVEWTGDRVITSPVDALKPLDFKVPGDPSCAAFLFAAALLTGGQVTVPGLSTNRTRSGFLETISNMGAQVVSENHQEAGPEPSAVISVSAAELHGIDVAGDLTVRMIDELPIFALVASQARGRTHVRDATELRVKETDRLAITAQELSKLGVKIEVTEDGWIIDGPCQLVGSQVDSHGDHRLAMTLIVAGLAAKDQTTVSGVETIDDSFPGFFECLKKMGV